MWKSHQKGSSRVEWHIRAVAVPVALKSIQVFWSRVWLPEILSQSRWSQPQVLAGFLWHLVSRLFTLMNPSKGIPTKFQSHCPSNLHAFFDSSTFDIHTSVSFPRGIYAVSVRTESTNYHHYSSALLAVMFAGVEVLNDCNYGSKGQNLEDLSLPEIQVGVATKKSYIRVKMSVFQMSLIENDDAVTKSMSTDHMNLKLTPKVSEMLSW